jgi:hypothetical protein
MVLVLYIGYMETLWARIEIFGDTTIVSRSRGVGGTGSPIGHPGEVTVFLFGG